MAVTAKNKRIVWALSAARCAICRKPLVQKADEAGAYSFLGDVAHIYAKRDGGPRADASLAASERDHPNNLFLLCLDHHKMVDDHPEIYTAEKLIELRDGHLSWVRGQLESGTPWTSDIYNFYYLNLPRILMLAEIAGIRVEDPSLFDIGNINALGDGYIRFIRSTKALIESVHPNVVALDSLSLKENDTGLIAKFDQRFRTKGLGKALMNGFDGFVGDLSKYPNIYTECNGYKFVMPLDPRWLTTTTAGVHLSSGQGVFSGLCIVNSINDIKKIVLCSPLIIGHPKKW